MKKKNFRFIRVLTWDSQLDCALIMYEPIDDYLPRYLNSVLDVAFDSLFYMLSYSRFGKMLSFQNSTAKNIPSLQGSSGAPISFKSSGLPNVSFILSQQNIGIPLDKVMAHFFNSKTYPNQVPN